MWMKNICYKIFSKALSRTSRP